VTTEINYRLCPLIFILKRFFRVYAPSLVLCSQPVILAKSAVDRIFIKCEDYGIESIPISHSDKQAKG
jgi:hypothetical protein